MRQSEVRRAAVCPGRGRRKPRGQSPHAHPLEPRRLLSAADLDPTFGAGGRVVLDNHASLVIATRDTTEERASGTEFDRRSRQRRLRLRIV
jgi:hypothetical protein